MKLLSGGLLPVLAILGLAACSDKSPQGPSVLSQLPEIVTINVYFDEKGCPKETRTSSKTCPFIGDDDPTDMACQAPTINTRDRRKIVWKSAPRSQDSPAFTLAFHDGSPFNPANGKCDISVASTNFRCNLRATDEEPALAWDYKYDVIVRAGTRNECRLDPRIYLMR